VDNPYPPATAPKDPKDRVGYRDGDNLRRCGTCRHFEAPKACQSVAGAIRPDGYCVRWELSLIASAERGFTRVW
jgi:hypothetical protein